MSKYLAGTRKTYKLINIGIQATEKEVTQTGDEMDEAPVNHTSEITVANERNVAESENKIFELDKRNSLMDSE